MPKESKTYKYYEQKVSDWAEAGVKRSATDTYGNRLERTNAAFSTMKAAAIMDRQAKADKRKAQVKKEYKGVK